MEFLRRHFGLIVRIAVTAVILFYLAGKINFAEIWEEVSNMNPWWVFVAFLIFGPVLALTAWRWRVLLEVQQIHLPFSQVFQLNLVGQFFNAFLLGSTGGDVVKIYYAAKAAPRKRSAAGLSVILDRVIGMLVLLGIALVFIVLFWQFLTSDPQGDAMPVGLFGKHFELTPALAVYLVLFIATAAVLVIAASLFLPTIKATAKEAGIWDRLPLHGTLEHLFDAYQRYHTAYGALALVTLLSVGNHMMNIAIGYVILLAMDLSPPFWQMAAVLPIIYLLIAIPISVSGFGVREGLCILFFSLFGYSLEQAIAFSITYWVVLTLWSLVGGLFYLRYETPPDLATGPDPLDPAPES